MTQPCLALVSCPRLVDLDTSSNFDVVTSADHVKGIFTAQLFSETVATLCFGSEHGYVSLRNTYVRWLAWGCVLRVYKSSEREGSWIYISLLLKLVMSRSNNNHPQPLTTATNSIPTKTTTTITTWDLSETESAKRSGQTRSKQVSTVPSCPSHRTPTPPPAPPLLLTSQDDCRRGQTTRHTRTRTVVGDRTHWHRMTIRTRLARSAEATTDSMITTTVDLPATVTTSLGLARLNTQTFHQRMEHR